MKLRLITVIMVFFVIKVFYTPVLCLRAAHNISLLGKSCLVSFPDARPLAIAQRTSLGTYVDKNYPDALNCYTHTDLIRKKKKNRRLTFG
jgi:hypothetical protein